LAWHFDKPLVVIEHGKMPLPAAQRRAAITFSVINQSLLPNRSEMSLESAALDTAKLRR
jgi:hypothetical protein